jgi:hypothetical protein
VVFSTPLTLSNTACVPQKQPPAKTAVSFPGATASDASSFAEGIGDFVAAPAEQEKVRATNPRVRKERIERTSILGYVTRYVLSGLNPLGMSFQQ